MLLYLVQFMGGRGRGEERRTKPVKKNRDPRWEEEFQFTLDEPPTNDRIHVEVVSTSSRMGLLHPKLLPSSELLWITLTTLTVVHFGCVITLAARLFTSAARHPARLLDILLSCSGDMKGSASGGDRSSKRDIVGAQIDPNALVAHQQSFTQGMNYLNSEV